MHENLIKLFLVAQTDVVSAAPPVSLPWYQEWYGVLAIIAAVVGIPIFLGVRTAKALRMRDYGWKIALILFTMIAGLLVVATGKFQRGYDLAGGVSLIYEIDPNFESDEADLMDKMIDAISPRIDPAGVMQVTIRKYGDRQVEIIIPNVNEEEAEQIKKRISTAGNLGFRILADRELDREIVLRAENTPQSFVADQTVPAQKTIAKHIQWIDAAEGADKDVEIDGEPGAQWIDVPEDKIAEVRRNEKAESYVTRTKDGRYQQLQILGQIRARWVEVGKTQDSLPRVTPQSYNVSRKRKDGRIDILVLVDRHNVGGGYLNSARAGFRDGRIAVDFSFNTQGAKRFGALTQETVERDRQSNRKHHLGILLDDELLSAPTLNTVIRESGQITGDFTEEEVNWLVGVLNAGRLPAALNKTPISEQKISPTLGEETITAGTEAIGISLLVVIAFMPLYYRFAGLVACFALLMNLVLVLAVMVAVRAAFTLPGLAGLVLTVGMAVDANVLIFERIREEMDRGAALRMAIRNGFGRATRTIVDANVTTLITGVVLYVVGTDQIKGFAVTLILGIVMSMYTAIFCSRVIFDIGEKKHWITKLSMTRILGKTNVDFLSKQRIAIACSLLLAIVGIVGVITRTRGSDLLDIDLSGGVAIEVVFKQADMTETDIQRALEDYSNTLPKAEKLTPLSVTGITGGRSFKVETRRDELQPVKDAIQHVFGDALSTNSLSYNPSAIKPIGTAAADTSGAAEAQPDGNDGAAGNGATNPKPNDAAEKSSASSDADPEKTPNGSEPLDANKPADPPGADPAGADPPGKDSQQPGEPAATDGARLDLPPLSLLALAEDPEIGETTATDGDTGLEVEAGAEPPGAEPDAAAPKAEDDGTAKADDAAATPDAEAAVPANSDAANKPDPSAGDATDPPPAEAEPADIKPSPTDAAGASADAEDSAKDQATPPATTGPGTDSLPAGDTTDTPPAEVDPFLERFAGGTEVRLKFQDEISRPTLEEMLRTIIKRQDLTADLDLASPQIEAGSQARANQWTLRSTMSAEQANSVVKVLQEQLAAEPHFPTATTIGGQVAGNTQMDGLIAMIASLLCVVAYIWIRFQRVSYGLAAVVALVHDVLITLGLIALSAYVVDIPVVSSALQLESFKISLPILAAFLTIIGYSLNDTIVVFDRIREVKGKSPYLTPDMVNTSINQTMSRTLLTSFTTLIVVLILYFIGGAGIHGFAFALVIGVIVGTYSSIFIASPALLWMRKIGTSAESTPAPAAAKVPAAG